MRWMPNISYEQPSETQAFDLLGALYGDVAAFHARDHGEFVVPSPEHPGRTYTISAYGGVRVERAGTFLATLCIRCTEALPWADTLLTHALFIEGDEAGYLRKANLIGASLFLSDEDADLLVRRWPRWPTY